MKLSDIKGERTLDVIAELIDPISNIASDKVAADLFVRRQVGGDKAISRCCRGRIVRAAADKPVVLL